MGREILLIDDSAMLRRIADSVLRAQPARYQVVAATRATEGFARACAGETVLILIDERMAGSPDASFCRQLLQEPRTAGVPVVLMTGRRADALEISAQPANVVEILPKPFAPELLANVVNTIVALSKQGASLSAMRQAFRTGGEAGELRPFTDQPLPPEPTVSPGGTSLAAALQVVAADGATGVLRLRPAGGTATELFFESGRLVLVTTRDGTEYSRDAAAVLPAKVSPATLQEAAAEQSETGIPFLLTLGVRGVVSKAAGVALLERFGQRHFARLWIVPAKAMQIAFEPLEALPGFTLRLEPTDETINDWLLATLRTLTSADIAAEARHQGFVGTPRLLRRGEETLKTLTLDVPERAFMRQVNGRYDLPAIASNLGITPEEAFLLVFRFRCLEILEYRPAPLPFVVTPLTNTRRVLPLHR